MRRPAPLGLVLCLHSLGLDASSFDPLRAALGRDWTLMSFDQRGHGRLAQRPADSLTQLVDDAACALDSYGQQPVHLLGHSMGGAIAALLAARAPERIASLTLMASPARGLTAFAERGAAALDGGLASVIEPTIERWFGAGHGALGQTAYARGALRAMSADGFAAAWTALSQFEGYGAIAGRLPPTLCIAGTQDLSTPPMAMQQIVDAFVAAGRGSSALLEVVHDAGHMAPLTHASAVARLLDAHWRGTAHESRR